MAQPSAMPKNSSREVVDEDSLPEAPPTSFRRPGSHISSAKAFRRTVVPAGTGPACHTVCRASLTVLRSEWLYLSETLTGPFLEVAPTLRATLTKRPLILAKWPLNCWSCHEPMRDLTSRMTEKLPYFSSVWKAWGDVLGLRIGAVKGIESLR